MTDTTGTIARGTGWIAPVLCRLTGPIFDKEMRVSSRRRRTYVLRFIYIGLFTFLATMMWMNFVAHRTGPGSSSVYQISRMASAGQQIILAVLWFQFLTSQIIAIVMLSTSISDEIYKRTLGTLMTTPIGSFQIVVGKLASKLLQIVLLLAISLPLLAIVRVFGGVPWSVLVCGVCVTLTAVIFVGALSLFFSIFTRRAYTAIIESILAVAFLFMFLPGIVGVVIAPNGPSPGLVQTFACFNPYLVMSGVTESLYTARPALSMVWPLHCAIMLGSSAVVLLLAMVFVRRAALRQAVGGTVDSRRRRADGASQSAAIRRVVGPPVLWKERRIPLLGRRRLAPAITVVVSLGLLVLTYGLCWRADALKSQETHTMYGVVFFGLGLLFTTVLPATCITTERESQTWSLLLTTTVGTGEILVGKYLGALRRCLPAWLLLFVHVALFTALGIIPGIVLAHLTLVVFWVLLFLTGTGLCFSMWLRHTTTAVIANLALAAGLWAFLPLVWSILLGMAGARLDSLLTYMDMNPFVQAVVVMSPLSHRQGGAQVYNWLQGTTNGPFETTCWLLLTISLYLAAGLVLILWASRRLRRNPV